MAKQTSFMGRVMGFTVSFADWFAEGCPWRDPDETKELFELHCLGGPEGPPCPQYDAEKRAAPLWPKGTCTGCGCHVSASPDELLNKVNKPHMGCHLDKWKAAIEFDEETNPPA